jgi:hypothetical protein
MQLQTVMSRLTADSAALQRGGIEFRSWGVDYYRNRVSVGLARLDPAWIATLRQRDGGDLLAIYEGPAAVPVSRTAPADG